ncbi:FadR/GntR family transcriptional regulator [Acidipropionibacterium acidipropionici]|uniref:FadR/GntR family transcriptional regulator n=1 Tax=Acidipropionibacterium acidipropionici TaxID=1748 RepID=UPI0004110AAF|nr:FCD domain-containing protein [Acidipropionibacterium acidipropionici]ALN16338.1 GntR family transcriptional regulator [Acidipropionibacterium acidipropionici]APZ10610.1 GntR family transcriptional regulator [Acidipropionibacterium acidipropionici]
MAVTFLARTVSDELGRRIVDEELPAGRRMTLEAIESEFEVSRSVAREAVKILESLHMVRSRRRVGIEVLDAASWDVLAPRVIDWHLSGRRRAEELTWISELRSGVEPIAARLASTRADPHQCAELTGAVMGMAAAASGPDLESYLGHDIVFHRTLLLASGNPLIAEHAEVVEAVLRGRTNLLLFVPNPAAIALHREVVDAVIGHRGEDAEEAMRQIVAEAQEAMGA